MKETKTIIDGIRCAGCDSQLCVTAVVRHQEDEMLDGLFLQCTDRKCYYGSSNGSISIAPHHVKVEK